MKKLNKSIDQSQSYFPLSDWSIDLFISLFTTLIRKFQK